LTGTGAGFCPLSENRFIAYTRGDFPADSAFSCWDLEPGIAGQGNSIVYPPAPDPGGPWQVIGSTHDTPDPAFDFGQQAQSFKYENTGGQGFWLGGNSGQILSRYNTAGFNAKLLNLVDTDNIQQGTDLFFSLHPNPTNTRFYFGGQTASGDSPPSAGFIASLDFTGGGNPTTANNYQRILLQNIPGAPALGSPVDIWVSFDERDMVTMHSGQTLVAWEMTTAGDVNTLQYVSQNSVTGEIGGNISAQCFAWGDNGTRIYFGGNFNIAQLSVSTAYDINAINTGSLIRDFAPDVLLSGGVPRSIGWNNSGTRYFMFQPFPSGQAPGGSRINQFDA
jgi:hypothetical protein